MNTKKITVEVALKFVADEKLPNVLTIEGPQGYIEGEGGEVYFSENDGTKLGDLSEAFDFPKHVEWQSNGRNEAWLSSWNDDYLKTLDGKSFRVRFTKEYEVDEDGVEDWAGESAQLIPA